MKPKMLDPWTMSRVQQPVKAYEQYFFKDQPSFNFTNIHGKDFPLTDEGLPPRYKEWLDGHREKTQEWVESPSHFVKEEPEPLALSREVKCFRTGVTEGTFKDQSHVAWEAFQKTMKTNAY